jgi:hypothetical protein
MQRSMSCTGTSGRRRDAVGEVLPLPPAIERVDRVPFNSKIPIELRGRLDGFVATHRTTVQAVLEAALREYMDARAPAAPAPVPRPRRVLVVTVDLDDDDAVQELIDQLSR